MSFAGFVVMLGAALWFERSLRKMGRAGMAQLSASFHTGGLRDYFGDTGDRVRNRLRTQDDDAEDDTDRTLTGPDRTGPLLRYRALGRRLAQALPRMRLGQGRRPRRRRARVEPPDRTTGAR